MTEREQQLLILLIQEYIATANPVGSLRLAQIAPFSVSPATIRGLLRQLEEDGYIWQPHTSAGRVPTDQGYRLYVDSLIIRDLTRRNINQLARQFKAIQAQYNIPGRAITKLIARLSGTVAVSSALSSQDIHEAGLRLLLDQPEGAQPEAIREVSQVLDQVEAILDKIQDQSQPDPVTQTFIGQENPVIQAEHTSILARRAQLKNGESIYLLVIGPKRMPYEKHVPLLNAMAALAEEISYH